MKKIEKPKFNEQQIKIIEDYNSNSLVLAGAGSGKTTVMTWRIAKSIENGVKPYNILAITFTNKAAREMKERLHKILGEEANQIGVYTFHSFCAKILRVYTSDKISLEKNFSIYDQTDSLKLIKEILKENGLTTIYKEKDCLSYISKLQANGYIGNDAGFEDIISSEYHPIYQDYLEKLEQNNSLDFGSLLTETINLLSKDKELLTKLQQKFKLIIVDEYQDTNNVQLELLKKLYIEENIICAVGDEDQSIYGWRNANIDNILNFQKDFPEVKLFKLDKNYRSYNNILRAANSVIQFNSERISKDKLLSSDKIKETKNILYSFISDNKEAEVFASKIKDLIDQGAKGKEIAVIYRNHSISRKFEKELRFLNIPYQIHGGISFFLRKDVKDILSYFAVLVNPENSLHMKRIINYPSRGVGKKAFEAIENYSLDKGLSFFDVLNIIKSNPKEIKLSKKALNSIITFCENIDRLHTVIGSSDPNDIFDEVINSFGFKEELEKLEEKNIEKYEKMKTTLDDLEDLIATSSANNVETFLEETSLSSSSDDEAEENNVQLLTMHASKGLEFEYVFLPAIEENILPSNKNDQEETLYNSLEEERRLFYVALTRAKFQVFMSYAKFRESFGKSINNPKSRFLREIGNKNLFKILSID